MKKNDLLSVWLQNWDPNPLSPLPAEYRAFFDRFNQGLFYEAHDVLEHLWLRCHDSNRSFYQALIQLAGAFVHFQKHALFPSHPTHQRRLAPGRRLLDLASDRLRPFAPHHLGIDVDAILQLCSLWKSLTESQNPLSSSQTPSLLPPTEPLFSPNP